MWLLPYPKPHVHGCVSDLLKRSAFGKVSLNQRGWEALLVWGFDGSFHMKLDLWLNKEN